MIDIGTACFFIQLFPSQEASFKLFIGIYRRQTSCHGFILWKWVYTLKGCGSFNDWNEHENISGFSVLANWVLNIALKHNFMQKNIVASVWYVMAQYLPFTPYESIEFPTWYKISPAWKVRFKHALWNAQVLLSTCSGLDLYRFLWPR